MIAYSKAIATINGLSFDIKDVQDVSKIAGIGAKMLKKIKEILETGGLEKVEKLQKNKKYGIASEFERVWGIGPTKAVELFNRGIKNY